MTSRRGARRNPRPNPWAAPFRRATRYATMPTWASSTLGYLVGSASFATAAQAAAWGPAGAAVVADIDGVWRDWAGRTPTQLIAFIRQHYRWPNAHELKADGTEQVEPEDRVSSAV